MRLQLSGVTGWCILLSVAFSFASPLDPQWMFSDRDDLIYLNFQYCDTARKLDFNCVKTDYGELTDTGSHDGSKYINLDYQFSSDSFYILNEWDPTDTIYRDCRPGYAGFKTAWDGGSVGFKLARYKSLVLKYKGPNPNHKVTVTAWYNNGSCGAKSSNEVIGSFSASAEWTETTIPIPESFSAKSDSLRNGSFYFELVFIINNLDPSDTTSGPPGNFKVDDIRLVGCNPIDKSPMSKTVNENMPCTLSVEASAPLNYPQDVCTYQWMKDGTPLNGATEAKYVISNAMLEQAGSYTVAVTVPSTGNTVVSIPAILTVTDDPNFTPGEENSGCGCGSGTGLALIPPVFIRFIARRKRKNAK